MRTLIRLMKVFIVEHRHACSYRAVYLCRHNKNLFHLCIKLAVMARNSKQLRSHGSQNVHMVHRARGIRSHAIVNTLCRKHRDSTGDNYVHNNKETVRVVLHEDNAHNHNDVYAPLFYASSSNCTVLGRQG